VKRVCILTLALFVALSACDFVFTYLLVEGGGGEVYEANPVAAGWLTDHGWLGLAAFKAAAVLVVVGAVGLIARRKPAVGVALACLGCLATAVVNLHSHTLLAASGTDTAEVRQVELLIPGDPDLPINRVIRARLPVSPEHGLPPDDRP
jgi:hypothetical protein